MTPMIPSPASTVVLVREASGAESQVQTLLLLRNHKLVFAGGAWVFPGGKVDPGDYRPVEVGVSRESSVRSASSADAGQADYRAAINAVVRETYEETGLSIPASDLIHIAHWTTPPGFPRRYATWFFLCPVVSPEPVQVDQQEILDYQWVTPLRALAMYNRGEIQLTTPTVHTLHSIAGYPNLRELCQAMRACDIHVFPEDSSHYQPIAACRCGR